MKTIVTKSVTLFVALGFLFANVGPAMPAGPAHEGGLGLQKIQVNIAQAKTLAKAKGVTDEIAKAIVSYRASKGMFKKPEDLLKVPGITQQVYKAMDPKVGPEGDLYLLPKEGVTLEEDDTPPLSPSKC
jgi:competence ComEA-like helix-hairpin-helix protein